MESSVKTMPDILQLENIDHQTSASQLTAHESAPQKNALHQDEVDNPHLAARIIDEKGKMTLRTLMSICFLGLSITAPLSCSQVMVGVVANDIALDLDMPPTLTNWLLAGWALAATVPVVIVGKISDVFGRRWVMIIGNAWCLLGCIIAGTAASPGQLLAGSIVCGFSFGFIIIAFTAIPELCPFQYRGLGLAWLELCLFAPWGVAAGILANLLTQNASWRYIYYIGIIYAGISLIGIIVFYHPPQGSEDLVGKSWQEVVRNFDYIGSVLFVAGSAVFILAFSWAGSPGRAWSSASVVAPLILGTLTLAATFAYEMVWADPDYAFMPRRLMLNFDEFSAVCVAGFVTGMVYYAGIQLLPQANVYVFGLDPSTAGIWLLPNGFGQLFGSTVVPGLLLRYTKAPKFWICLAVLLQTLFVGLYSYALPHHPAAWQAFQFFGQGCFDWIITCGVVNISLHVRQSDLGLALGLFGAARNLGGSVGTSIFLTILNGSVSGKLATRVPAAAEEAGYAGDDASSLIAATSQAAIRVPDAFAGLQSAISDAAAAAAVQAYRTSYAEAYRTVFYSTIPFGVVSFVVCLFIKDAGAKIVYGGLGPKVLPVGIDAVPGKLASLGSNFGECESFVPSPLLCGHRSGSLSAGRIGCFPQVPVVVTLRPHKFAFMTIEGSVCGTIRDMATLGSNGLATALVVEELNGPFVLQSVALSDDLRDDEMIVRMVATGVCHTDVASSKGIRPPAPPAIYGHEGAGVVETTGKAVRHVQPGDHVVLTFNCCGRCTSCKRRRPSYCTFGQELTFGGQRSDGSKTFFRDDQPIASAYFGQSSFATRSIVHVSSAVKVDSSLPLDVLCVLGCGVQTGAGTIINTLSPSTGASVAVYGGGGAVGLAAIAVAAKCTPASIVIALDVDENRLALARQFGATHVVNSKDGNARGQLLDITGGEGVDFAVDATGVVDVIHLMLECAAQNGVCATVGSAPADATVQIQPAAWIGRGVSYIGSCVGGSDPEVLIPAMISWWRQGRLPLDKMISLYQPAEMEQALQDMRTGKCIKPVFTWDRLQTLGS